jgi:hypothetical protein
METMSRLKTLGRSLCVLILLGAATLQAGVTTYSTQSTFDISAGGVSTQGFSGVAAIIGGPASVGVGSDNLSDNT